jgi:hypothetical protein
LILKYPDILTQEEQSKVNRLKDAMLFGVTSGIFAMPYSLYLGMKARRNPSMRTQYLKRMLILPTVPLFIILTAGAFAESNFKQLS